MGDRGPARRSGGLATQRMGPEGDRKPDTFLLFFESGDDLHAVLGD